ncbi:MAG: type I-E CRISPR-associated protein Cas7/Cse4/CasC [Anaerolineales bacterium]|jgi:CRISPR system Cascade subunit CasC|nr:type I-E CRISPR-associated protein Cas7/Cse4/CasC [Anaerolineales bacterium]MDX9935802.1 type I-E CRISPR-associated protein Cas7/Cse4/CasC [Anaerolineales bacterium]GER79723.1 type I-E CRISPR-associated protein Cas7/Cse4/CasC [Candidatus Denitrolinea symbiosum]HPO87537.1 type I-E CRISPR-associated protein Cas7/Cse4/CasC [Candidatus Hydrogenedentota bacterium]
MFIELHILQNFAPSNLNRDDTGNPKDTEFGGVRRARISSQAIKRAMRKHDVFKNTVKTDIGFRTRYLTRKLNGLLEKSNKPAEESAAITRAIAALFTSKKGKMDSDDPNRTLVPVYLTNSDAEWLKAEIVGKWSDLLEASKVQIADEEDESEETDKKKKKKKASIPPALKDIVDGLIDRTSKQAGAPDIALFGRMLADRPDTNVDAACQVSHAISTHRVNMELDYFTAVDDLQKDEETGAAMIGVTAFNSACFYRYARIDWGLLVKNLGDDKELARKTVEGFLRAAALAIPSGKQNSFAAQNPPDFMLGVVRKDGQSWSLANAFETPVKPGRDGGLMSASIQKLDEYWAKLNKAYGGNGMTTAALSLDVPPANLPTEENMESWLKKLLGSLE